MTEIDEQNKTEALQVTNKGEIMRITVAFSMATLEARQELWIPSPKSSWQPTHPADSAIIEEERKRSII